MKVILQKSEEINRNILYTKDFLKSMVRKNIGREFIGELNPNHNQKDYKKLLSVDLSNACCIIKNVQFEDGNLVADVKILDNDKKQLITYMIDNNTSFGIRGVGKKRIVDGITKFDEKEFKLITFDLLFDK